MSIDLAVLVLIKVWFIDGLISGTKAIVFKSSHPKKKKKFAFMWMDSRKQDALVAKRYNSLFS